MNEYIDKVRESAEYLRRKLDQQPEILVVLGSGLGPLVDEIRNSIEIDYDTIPHFPKTTVPGHAGRLVAGEIGGRYVAAMKGRFHYYEGHDVPQVVFPVRAFCMMGVQNLFVTNAAGGINKSYVPGDLMLIRDHIGFFAPSVLRGANMEELGTRFPDMTNAYDKTLRMYAKQAAEAVGVRLQEGVYAFAQGPMYETPAEVKALEILGADAVGMSTVPEVIAARHAGMRIMGISCITNMAAGTLDRSLSHEEVMITAKEAEKKFIVLVSKLIADWPGQDVLMKKT